MSFACLASSAGGARWAIIRKPATSMPSSRAVEMCWAETSASVQWVATRTERMPSSAARRRSAIVPTPGSNSVVGTAFCIARAGGLDPVPIGVASGAVVDTGAGQSVAMRDLDRGDTGRVECRDDHCGVRRARSGAAWRACHRAASHPGRTALTGVICATSEALADRDLLGHPHRRGGHDVEVAGVRRKVVGCALYLEERRHLPADRPRRRRASRMCLARPL